MAYVGVDCGTYNLVCTIRNKEGDFVHKREVNAFIEFPLENDFVFKMMKKSGVPLIEKENVAYALGEAAVTIASTLPTIELKRPMKDGCVNPKEKDSFQIMNIMMHSLIGEAKSGDIIYYSIPANAVNEETDADYHNKILEAIFKAYKDENGFGIVAKPINEALALVYSELAHKMYTGIGISCLRPETKIYTNRGIINIEDVKEGDQVITHKGRWRNVNKVITKQYKGLSTNLQLQGYSNNTNMYKFVDNHELYVKRNNKWKWIGCEELVEGDIVGEPIVKQDRTKNRPTITICERITCSKEWNKKHIAVTSNVQRLIGYFLGDGSVNEAEGCIQFDFSKSEKDLKNIDDVCKILKTNFDKESSITKKEDNCFRVKCYSKGLVSWFRNHCNDENKEKIYPWNLDRINKSDCINLLSGLIRSDGNFSDSTINFSNSCTNLILLAKQLFSKLGIAATLSFRSPREGHLLACGRWIRAKKDAWQVSTGSKNSLQSLKDIIENIDCENSCYTEKLYIEDGFCCSSVQKIEHEEYEGIVYDLQVEEDHSFSGPFLTIHNCGAGMVNICFAIYGKDMFTFSIVNSGDWIDKQAAKATGESIAFINKEKTKIDLDKEPTTLVERAIITQYKLMIEKTVAAIKHGLENNSDKKAKLDAPIDVVIAGGTSSPNGFEKFFAKVLKEANLPMQIGEIIKPKDPLYSVGRGCLIAAEASGE